MIQDWIVSGISSGIQRWISSLAATFMSGRGPLIIAAVIAVMYGSKKLSAKVSSKLGIDVGPLVGIAVLAVAFVSLRGGLGGLLGNLFPADSHTRRAKAYRPNGELSGGMGFMPGHDSGLSLPQAGTPHTGMGGGGGSGGGGNGGSGGHSIGHGSGSGSNSSHMVTHAGGVAGSSGVGIRATPRVAGSPVATTPEAGTALASMAIVTSLRPVSPSAVKSTQPAVGTGAKATTLPGDGEPMTPKAMLTALRPASSGIGSTKPSTAKVGSNAATIPIDGEPMVKAIRPASGLHVNNNQPAARSSTGTAGNRSAVLAPQSSVAAADPSPYARIIAKRRERAVRGDAVIAGLTGLDRQGKPVDGTQWEPSGVPMQHEQPSRSEHQPTHHPSASGMNGHPGAMMPGGRAIHTPGIGHVGRGR
jgi:hypothetical protein